MHPLGAAGSSGDPVASLLTAKTALVAAGLVVGAAAGGALVVTGVFSPGQILAPTVALYACPDGAVVVERVPAGQQLLVTARSADGGWLQVYLPDPATDRAWTHAGALQVDGDVGSLPVASCGSSAGVPEGGPSGATELVSVAQPTASPSLSPGVTPSPSPSPAPSASPSVAPPSVAPPSIAPPSIAPPSIAPPSIAPPSVAPPSVAPPSVAPPSIAPPSVAPPSVTPAPDTEGPDLWNLAANPTAIFSGESCCGSQTTTVSVNAYDPSGVWVVGLAYAPPGEDFIAAPMTAGDSGLWTYTITADGDWSAGDINYYVYAFDLLGNQSPDLDAVEPISFKHCIC